MAIAFVNSAKIQNTSTSSSMVITTSSVVAGNVMVVGLAHPLTASILKIVDNVGSNYQKLQAVSNSANTVILEVWICPCLAGTATSVTATLSASVRSTGIVSQYSGVLGFGLSGYSSGSTSPATITMATQDANNYICAFFALMNTSTWASSTGSLRNSQVGSSTNTPGVANEDNTAVSAGSVTAACTLGTPISYVGVAVELRTVAQTATLANNTAQLLGAGI